MSIGKGRHHSTGSDISSVYSGGDGALYKDHTRSLAASAEALEEDCVPPVPPLPKDLSNYHSPRSLRTALPFLLLERMIMRLTAVSLEVP